jgi:hypothetical protein
MTTIDEMTPAQRDAWVYEAKHSGATWKSIALTCGWGWNGGNMDGGRAKRAFNRHNKIVQAAKVETTLDAEAELIEAEVEKEIFTVADEEQVEAELTIFDQIAALLEAGKSQRGVVNELEDLGVTLTQVRKVAKSLKEGRALAA